jgi:heat shock protein HspQ
MKGSTIALLPMGQNAGLNFATLWARYAHYLRDKAMKTAKFAIGQVVRHRIFPFRGVIFDVDPQFSNTDEWYEAIPVEARPRKDQPFYHLLAENSETDYIAYVSEQNLLEDQSGDPVQHPQIPEFFEKTPDGRYAPRGPVRH